MLTHTAGTLLILTGAALQQLAFLKQQKPRKIKTCSSNKPNLLLIISCGLATQLCSIFLIPLSSYVLLSSVHFLYYINFTRKQSIQPFQTLSILFYTLSSIVLIIGGGVQVEFTPTRLQTVINYSYFIWMCGGLALNLTLRRLGFYKERAYLQSCIPAQLTCFGLGGLKLVYFTIEMYLNGYDFQAVLFLVGFGVCVVFLGASSSFLKKLGRHYNNIQILGSYYAWNLCYSLPLALFVLQIGNQYSFVNYACVVVGFGLVQVSILGVLKTSLGARGDFKGLRLELGEEQSVLDQIDEHNLIHTTKNIQQ